MYSFIESRFTSSHSSIFWKPAKITNGLLACIFFLTCEASPELLRHQKPGHNDLSKYVGDSDNFVETAIKTVIPRPKWWKDGSQGSQGAGSKRTPKNLPSPENGLSSAVGSYAHDAMNSESAQLEGNFAILDSGFDPSPNGSVICLALQSNGRILVGGSFSMLAGEKQHYLGRLNRDGTLDATFNPEFDNWVNCLAVQTDGKILVGGRFTTLGGQGRDFLGRLNSDGTLDPTFPAEANGEVSCLALQEDGKILVGGQFTMLGGQARTRIGRLNLDGSLDTQFDPGADNWVYSIVPQPDRKIQVSGVFKTLGGQPRNYVGRLNPDGSLDSTFKPVANNIVLSQALQVNGKVLLGGSFTTLDNQPRDRIGRLNPDGTLDSAFNPGADSFVHALAVQADGKILVGGEFTMLGGEFRNRIGRLNADGTLDPSFHLGDGNGRYSSLVLQDDGDLLVGGEFTLLDGETRSRIGRLKNSGLAVQTLSHEGSTITWQRGGTSPQVWRSTFDHSSDGLTWISLGSGLPILGGWQSSNLSLPGASTIRARGYVTGDSGSSWFVESYTGPPLLLTQPYTRTNIYGSIVTFSIQAVGTEPLVFQWHRDGLPLVDGGKISGAKTATLTVGNVGDGDEGAYRVVVSNVHGEATSLDAPLEVSSILDCGLMANTTLPLTGSPYHLTCNVEFENVTVEPGVRIEAGGDFEIKVRGGLQAVGTEEHPIVFTTTDDPSIKWQGLYFEGSTADSELAYCIVENSVNSGIRINDASPILRYCNIRRNQALHGAGINISGSMPVTLQDSIVCANTYSGRNPRGGGIYTTSPLTLIGCKICCNKITDYHGNCFDGQNATTFGGGIYSEAELTLEDVVVKGNKASSRGGGENSRGGGVYTSDRLVARNCIIANNSAGAGGCNIGNRARGYGGGIYCGSTLLLKNCIITDNRTRNVPAQGFGGGVYAADGTIENCTVAHNNGPGGVHFSGSGSIVNSIVWGNSSYQLGGGATATFSCVEGIATSDGNISSAPMLPPYDPAVPEETRIPCYSPCVDAGNPAPEYRDASNAMCDACGTTRNDMGVHGGPGRCSASPIFEIFHHPETFDFFSSDWDSDNCEIWQIGIPIAGPPVNIGTGHRALSPVNVAATLLGDDYPANSQGRLFTPRFYVPSVAGDDRVILRFWQWYEYGTGDSGIVQIKTPYNIEWMTLNVATEEGSSPDWELATVDLTPFQGQYVQIGFLHSADGDSSRGGGWFIDDVSLSEATPSRLEIGMATESQFTGNSQTQYHVVQVLPGGHLRIKLDDLDDQGINELYVKRGSLPTPGSFDYRFTVTGGADQSIFVPNADAGDWFILAYNDSGPLPGDYTMEVEFSTGVILESLSPTTIGNSVPSTVTINGAGFSSSDTVELVNGGNVYPASEVFFVSRSQLVTDFDFPAIPAGAYQLTVTSGENSDSLPFEMIQGIGARLETRLTPPSRVGYHALATIWVEYANTGDAPMPAPLLEVSARQNDQLGAWLTLDEDRLVRGFWTSAQPEGFSHSVQFLASGETPGLLQPGESGRLPVYYAGWKRPWNFSYPPIFFNLGILESNNSDLVDWLALKDFMRPSSHSTDAWEAVFANLVAQTGPTWGDYVKMLNDNARYLHRLDQRVTDIRDLLGFEVMQAGGLSLTRTCASAVDAQVQTPGLPLIFTRSFGTDIPQRYGLGRFGRGWSDNWKHSLEEAADGTVTIFGPGGSRRVFQPDSRKAAYFASSGDTARLTVIAGGAFTLRERDGSLYAFRPDGKLDYLADPHDNRVTCAYNGDLLTRLTHSAGPFLDLAYSGNRVAAITDSLGRQTTFTYTGEHLFSVTDHLGRDELYFYNTGDGPAREHALTSVHHRDGTESNYAYDGQGRLVTKAGCCGSPETTTYSYDSAGRITATDALGNATKSYFDHRGRLARTEDSLGHITHRTFDRDGRLLKVTDPGGSSRQFAYDTRGNLIRETDQLGYATRYTYTADFNLLDTLIDAKGNVTRYGYDANGSLTSITYADGSIERWVYDGQGNRTSWTNRRGQTIHYTNDVMGRLTARAYPGGVVHTFDYDAEGNLTGYTDPLGATAQEFDEASRLAKVTYPGDRWLGYTYDDAGRRASMTNELGHQTHYHYDLSGRLKRLTDENDLNIVVYTYDAVGRMALKTLGNGVYTTYDYDPAGQLLDLFNQKPDGSVLSRFQYTYDSRGRRDTMTTTYGADDPRTDLAGTWHYDYDDTGQLIGWTAPWGRRVDYTYDPLGNRLNVRDDGIDTPYTVNNLNQYIQVSSTTYQYDADGNLTNKIAPDGTTTYEWSFENKLLEVATSSGILQNGYDANGNRTRIVDGGTVKDYVIDPAGLGNVAAEYSPGDSTPLAVFHHGSGLLARWAGTEIEYYAFDALGSSSELIGDTGTITDSYAYLPFGELAFNAETTDNPFQFVGEAGVMATRAGLHHMRARHYDGTIGRFITSDPAGIGAGDANLYRYTGNIPTQYTDASGQNPLAPILIFCGLRPQLCAAIAAGVADCVQALFDVTFPIDHVPGLGELIQSIGVSWVCGKIRDLFRPPDPDPQPEPNPNPDPEPPNFCELYPELCMCFIEAPMCTPVPPTPPWDPNEKTGPTGFSPANYVSLDAVYPYKVEFENLETAPVPAQTVLVSDELSPHLDWSTFELTEIGFGDVFIAVLPGTKRFEKTEKVQFDGVDFEVEIEAGIRLETGEVFATFRSIVPETGLPPSIEIGFLPPEDGTGRGQGRISYIIWPHKDLPTGTEIRNVAHITFDGAQTFRTDLSDAEDPNSPSDLDKQALLTIDADPPTSTVSALPDESGRSFLLEWGGDDIGAGIGGYDIYVSVDGGEWMLWLSGTTETSGIFEAELPGEYRFYSVAHDLAGNGEAAPEEADAVTNFIPEFKISARYSVGNFILEFYALEGATYHLEYLDNLESSDWQVLNGTEDIQGTGEYVQIQENISNLRERYYRVVRDD